MDDKIKVKMITALKQYIDNMKQMEDVLKRFSDSKDAIWTLNQAKYNLLAAQHHIKWIGISNEKEVQEEILSYTDEDNPSA